MLLPDGQEEREIFMEDLYAEQDADQVAMEQLKAHMAAQGIPWQEEEMANGQNPP